MPSPTVAVGTNSDHGATVAPNTLGDHVLICHNNRRKAIAVWAICVVTLAPLNVECRGHESISSGQDDSSSIEEMIAFVNQGFTWYALILGHSGE